MDNWLGAYPELWRFIEAAVLIILIVAVLLQGIKLRRLTQNYRNIFESTGAANLEEAFIQLKNKVAEQVEASQGQIAVIEQLQEQLKQMKSNVSILRYNAFNERGSDLSFSIAIVDEYKTGVVLSGIHSREETYVYAKPIEHGESSYALSPEEKTVINRALQPSPNQPEGVLNR